jgi:hypothetical protein
MNTSFPLLIQFAEGEQKGNLAVIDWDEVPGGVAFKVLRTNFRRKVIKITELCPDLNFEQMTNAVIMAGRLAGEDTQLMIGLLDEANNVELPSLEMS